MRPDLVVVLAPLLDGDFGFHAVPKPLQAHVLVATRPVERFVGAILPWLARVDERRLDVRGLHPALDRARDELGSVVPSESEVKAGQMLL